MLHASVIMFSPRVWGVGSHVSLKITCRQVPLAEMSVQTCMGYSLIFFPDAFPLFPYTHTLFSHTSLQQLQDLGKTIRKLPKSFLILWNCSGFRANLFLHLFFFKFLKKKTNPWISSLFFCTSLYPFSACVHREKVSETQNVKFYPHCCTSLV